jgi:hypothetical protein
MHIGMECQKMSSGYRAGNPCGEQLHFTFASTQTRQLGTAPGHAGRVQYCL